MVPPSKDSSTSTDDLNDRTLPHEITGDIIGQLRNQRDLLACSLVSWAWLAMSRKCLHVHLHSDRIHQFHELIDSPTNTISAIRTIEIADLQMPQLLSLLPRFVSLRMLSLSFWFALTEDFSDMPGITRLNLRAIVFTTYSRFCAFIAKFPALKDLYLSDVTWERVESNQSLLPNFDFESLHLHSGHGFAPEAFVFATTRHFSLDFPQSTISSDLSRLVSLYLGSLGGPLRHLELNCCEDFVLPLGSKCSTFAVRCASASTSSLVSPI
ncbi:hypothetical protein DFH06DRAFT_189532 [Mycena polygramma]|nr:hypothetical protein DFH06DRAFT_189532 [Mycena polygramma]